MTVGELKKIVESYIKTHSSKDEVVLRSKDDDGDAIPVSIEKMNVKSSRVNKTREKYIASCGWEYDCYTPGKPCYDMCKNCEKGGIKYREKLIFTNDDTYGKSVLSIG